MDLLARILGAILLLFWLYFIIVARGYVKKVGSIMQATAFQYNILPFIIGIALLISGNILVILFGVLLWFIVPFMPGLVLIVPLVFGWTCGNSICSALFPNFQISYWLGGIAGAFVMYIFCGIIFTIITTSRPLVLIVPLVFGWTCGYSICTALFPDFQISYWLGGITGAFVMYILCSIIVIIITISRSGKPKN